MAQGEWGRIVLEEDFSSAIAATLTDATEYRYGKFRLAAISGDVAADIVVDEGNGVATFSGAGGAADGIAIYTLPFIPAYNGTMTVEARWKSSVITDYRSFLGFQQTVSVAEPVNPFTLSGTTLTANNGGEVFGLYFDAQATTDDVRMMSSTAGVADTTAINADTGSALGALGVRANGTVTADSWQYGRVEIDPDGACRAYYGDVGNDPNNTGPKRVGSIKAGVLSATAALHPMLLLACQSTGDPLFHVDFIRVTAYRDWRYATP
jgi:hypothetical protein